MSVRCAFGVIWRVSQIPKCGFSGRHAATEGEGRLLPGEPLRPPGGGRGRCPWSWCPARPPCAPFVLPRKLVRNRAPTPDSSPPGFSARGAGTCRKFPGGSPVPSDTLQRYSLAVERGVGERGVGGGGVALPGGTRPGVRRSVPCHPPACTQHGGSLSPSRCGEGPVLRNRGAPGPGHRAGRSEAGPSAGPPCTRLSLRDPVHVCVCVGQDTPARGAPPSRRRQGPEDEGFLHVSRQEHSGQASTASGLGALPRPRRRKPLTRGPPAASPRPFVSYFASRANGAPSRCLRVGKPGCGGRGAVRGLRRPPPRTRTPHGYAEAAAIASSWLCGILRDSVCGMRGRGRAVRPGEEPSGR